MNKGLLGFLAVAGVLVGLGVGYFAFSGGGSLGAASVTASNALNQQRLVNEFQAIANPLTGWLSTSTTFNGVSLGTLGASTSTASTTMTLTGAAVGDYLVWGEASSTVGVSLVCTITGANAVQCYHQNMAGVVTAATSTVYVLDLPKATFVSPTGL